MQEILKWNKVKMKVLTVNGEKYVRVSDLGKYFTEEYKELNDPIYFASQLIVSFELMERD